jgi:amino-acid N-acetyltransferase
MPNVSSPKPPVPTVPTDPGLFTCNTACAPAKAVWSAATSSRLRSMGSLLLEVYVHDGIGTMVGGRKSSRACARPPRTTSVAFCSSSSRSKKTVPSSSAAAPKSKRDIANYTIIEHDGVIFGCAGAVPLPRGPARAKMAALTVSPQAQGQGRRRKTAQTHRTTRPPHGTGEYLRAHHAHHALVFLKRGFEPVSPDWLPEARKRKYNWDRRSQVLVKRLS